MLFTDGVVYADFGGKKSCVMLLAIPTIDNDNENSAIRSSITTHQREKKNKVAKTPTDRYLVIVRSPVPYGFVIR
jgi:hypothetical protein